MIVGLNGFMGAGKDTAGEYLVERYGFQRKSFAAPLKQSVANLFGISLDDIEQWKNDPTMEVLIQRNRSSEFGRARLRGESPPHVIPHVRQTFRQFLQRYGTEAHRDVFGQNFWVEFALKDIRPDTNYVFTDARFENELQAIQGHWGYNLCIIRDGEAGDHASEVEPPDYLIDYWVDNTGSINELYRNLDTVMGELGIRRVQPV